MTPSSEVPVEFLEKHDLDGDWEVRFTAEEYRAREIAQQYREIGHEVALVPLSPGQVDPGVDDLRGFGDDLDLDHDPLQYLEQDECAPCLDETYVVFTKDVDGTGDEPEPTDTATPIDDSLYR
jgi:hypothetical protein